MVGAATSVNINASGIQTFNATTGAFAASTVTQYGTVVAGANNTVQSISPGTSGQVLTSNGPSANPTFQTAASTGSLVLIQTQTASNSASLSFTTGITSTYKNYILICSGVIPVTNGVNLILTWSTDGGSSYITTGYQSGQSFAAYNSALISNANQTTGVFLGISLPNTAAAASNSTVELMNINSGEYPSSYGRFTRPGDALICITNSVYPTSATVNAFQLTMSSGNISSGTFSLYGVAQ